MRAYDRSPFKQKRQVPCKSPASPPSSSMVRCNCRVLKGMFQDEKKYLVHINFNCVISSIDSYVHNHLFLQIFISNFTFLLSGSGVQGSSKYYDYINNATLYSLFTMNLMSSGYIVKFCQSALALWVQKFLLLCTLWDFIHQIYCLTFKTYVFFLSIAFALALQLNCQLLEDKD